MHLSDPLATSTAADDREILGLAVGDSEEDVLARLVTGLKSRGLTEVRPVISDQPAGLVAALCRCFQGAAHQRRRVHSARSLLALIPKSHKDMVAAVFRTIFAQRDARAVSAAWDEVRDSGSSPGRIGRLRSHKPSPRSGLCRLWGV